MADAEEEEVGRGLCKHLMARRRATDARRAEEQQHSGQQRNLRRLKTKFAQHNFFPWTFFPNRTSLLVTQVFLSPNSEGKSAISHECREIFCDNFPWDDEYLGSVVDV